MTILHSLKTRYDRLSSSGAVGLHERGLLPPPGYSTENISFVVELWPDGNVCKVQDWREPGKRPIAARINVPNTLGSRTSGIEAKFLWDKTAYVFGASATSKRTEDEHAAFVSFHEKLLGQAFDEGLLAFLRFLRTWEPSRFAGLACSAEMLDQNVAFKLTGDHGLLHERDEARRIWLDYLSTLPAGEGVCLVTGEQGRIALLHPPLRGVPGAQSSGASLVSFNEDAFNSYGKVQGGNAPVSEYSAFAYATALNDLLAATRGTDPKTGRLRYRNRTSVGDCTVVFWAERPEAEELIERLLAPDEQTETAGIRNVVKAMQTGKLLHEGILGIDPNTRAYVLALSPNAARLSVRFWLDGTLGDLARCFAEHWADLHLEPAPCDRPPALSALHSELAAHRKVENVLAHLAGELTRAIINGTLYPASVLVQVIMHLRSDHQITPVRAALIKAILARRARYRARLAHIDWKDSLVSLNRQEPNAGYRLGRLFAVLEAAQYAGIGRLKAAMRDKFFGPASATPGHVFPLLLRRAQDHLSAARKKDRAGRAVRLDREISEIIGGFTGSEPFPATLSLEDQGRFVIGFYHQNAELRIPWAKGEEIAVPGTEDADIDC